MFDALPTPNPQGLAVSHLREERLNDRGLPKPRFSSHEHYLACSGEGLVEPPAEMPQLHLSPHRAQHLWHFWRLHRSACPRQCRLRLRETHALCLYGPHKAIAIAMPGVDHPLRPPTVAHGPARLGNTGVQGGIADKLR